MPDFFSVPIAAGLFTDLNSQIAKGPDYSFIGNLPDAFFKGRDQQYVQNNRDVFKNGLPTDANGNIDYTQVAKQLAQVGGAGQVSNLVSLSNAQLGRDVLQKATQGGLFGSPGESQPTTALAPPSSATAVPNSVPRVAQPLDGTANSADIPTGTKMPPGQNLTGPNTTITGIDVQNAPIMTPRAIAQRTGGDAQTIASQLGVGVDQTVDTTDPQVRARIAAIARPQQVAQAPQSVPQQSAAVSSGTMNEGTAQAYENRATRAYQIGTALGFVNPSASATYKALGDQLMKQAEIIRGALARNSELTPEQKNAAASGNASPIGFEQDKARAGEAGKFYQKQYESINKAGTEAAVEKPQLDLIKSMFNDPNFYSGPAENVNLAYKRWLATLGGDPNTAQPQEAFRKIISNSILSMIRSMAGTGQIRVAEIKIMEKAAANPDNSPAANRLLVNIASRLYDRASAVDQLARNYNGGRLDSGFDNQLRQYDQTHPLFSQQELRDPRLIAPPVFRSPQDVMNSGLKSGSPFQTPDGRIKYVP